MINSDKEFLAICTQISIIIDKLKSIKIDTTNIEKEYKSILNSVEEELDKNKKSNKLFNADLNNLVYDKSLKELRKLIINIKENYDIYFKIDNFIEFINSKLKENKEISNEELDEYISTMINYLKYIVSNNFNNINVEDLINRLYKISYNLIKVEFIKNNNSLLLEYINRYDIHKMMLNKIIIEDLKEYENNAKIQDIIFELNSKGIDIDYVNEDLIKELANNGKQYKVVKDKDVIDRETEGSEKKLYSQYNNFLKAKRKYKNAKKKLATKITAYSLLAATIIGGNIFALNKLSKNTSRTYKTTTTTYTDTIENKSINTSYELRDANGNNKSVTLIVESHSKVPNSNTVNNITAVYDLTDLNINDIEDYFNLNLEQIKPVTAETERINDSNDIKDSTTKELIIKDFDYDDCKKDYSGFAIGCIFLIGFEAVVLEIYIGTNSYLKTIHLEEEYEISKEEYINALLKLDKRARQVINDYGDLIGRNTIVHVISQKDHKKIGMTKKDIKVLKKHKSIDACIKNMEAC